MALNDIEENNMLKSIIKDPEHYFPKLAKKTNYQYSPLLPVFPVSANSDYSLISNNNIFTDSPAPYWKKFIDKTTIEHFKRRETIYLSGDSTENVYLVMKGLVMLSQLQKNGIEVGQSIEIPNCTFGELEVLNQTYRVQQATALSDCQLCIVPADLFDRLTQKSAYFSRNVAKLISQRHQRSDYRQACLALLDVPHRLAKLLLEMANTIGYKDDDGYHFKPCFTHQDMATLIISSRETVCSIMSNFRKLKIIDFDRKHVSIIDIDALENY